MAPLAGMSKAWVQAEAALPHGWELLGVARGPRVADPVIEDESWVAWARPKPEAERKDTLPAVEGSGGSAEEALQVLARQLRAVRGSKSG